MRIGSVMSRRKQWGAGAAVMGMVVTATVVVASGGPAFASGGCGTLNVGHCYALAQAGTYAGHVPMYISAIGADLEVDCLAVANDSTEVATWEMWMSTNDTNPNSTTDSGYWIEEGYEAGPLEGGTTGFQWFWADKRPGGGYTQHFIEWATAYQYKNVTFTFEGGTNWGIYLGGNLIGQSVNSGGYAGGTEIGAEMGVDGNGQVHAHVMNWQFTDGGSWQPVFPPSVGTSANNAPGFVITWAFNPTGISVHTPSHLCGTVPQIVRRTSPTTGSAPTLATVRSIAARTAASFATATPTAMTAVRTTRGAANALYGSDVAGASAAQPVYLVQELGSFSTQRESPNGAKEVVSGRAMHVVIDATTGQVLDWGIQSPGNLHTLGLVTPLS